MLKYSGEREPEGFRAPRVQGRGVREAIGLGVLKGCGRLRPQPISSPVAYGFPNPAALNPGSPKPRRRSASRLGLPLVLKTPLAQPCTQNARIKDCMPPAAACGRGQHDMTFLVTRG